jgi:sarcosine oxidase
MPGVTVSPEIYLSAPPDDETGDFFAVPRLLSRAADLGVRAELLDEAGLREAFPSMRFAPGHVGVLQPDAMIINPRQFVRAEVAGAVQAGAPRIVDEVRSVEGSKGSFELSTRSGARYLARTVVLAAGPYLNLAGLSPKPLAFDVYGCTVILAEVAASEPAFPTTMYLKVTDEAPYAGIIVPPLPYPDGSWYIKGAGPLMYDSPLQTVAEAADWVRHGGDEATGPELAAALAELLPDTRVGRVIVRPCLVSLNEDDAAYVGFVEDGLVVATEGSHGVTMGDELGRLAARLALDGCWRDTLPEEPFAPRFR